MYEIDRAEVLTYKAEKLGASGAKPMCAEHHLLHADVVADPWDKMLLERGGHFACCSALILMGGARWAFCISQCLDNDGWSEV